MTDVSAEINYFRGRYTFKSVKLFQYIFISFYFQITSHWCMSSFFFLPSVFRASDHWTLTSRDTWKRYCPSFSCKSLASQMGFCSTLDPRDFCVCILILTQWVEIIFTVFFFRGGSEMGELNAFRQFFKKQKATFLKCQLLPVRSSDSRKTHQHLLRSLPPWKQCRNYTLRCDCWNRLKVNVHN